MGHFLGSGWVPLLMVAVSIRAQKTPFTSDLKPECLGNIVRLIVGPLLGRFEVDVIVNDVTVINLTPSLATQCGMSMKLDPMGNVMLFASVLSCFARNMDDKTFTLVGQLRLQGNHMSEDSVYRVGKTCSYTPWASREILCDRTYMEVSVRRTLPVFRTFPEQLMGGFKARRGNLRRGAEALASGYNMTAVVFSPSKKVMTVAELQSKGYAIANTPTRLVLRSPNNAEETYLQNVAGVPMRLLSTSTFFEQKWLGTRIDATAACPTPGSVAFTPEMITWYIPRHLDPLISSNAFTMLEVYMGIDAKRLDAEEMDARKYSLSVTDAHIIIEIPVGAVGGYFKSHVQDDQYFITYAIEPMLELLWIEEDSNEDTRYKVLFPITTPPMARPPQVRNSTTLDTEKPVFVFELGTFNDDVALLNITFPTGVLTVAECNARGFNVQEHRSLDNTSKTFTMEVPFSDPVVFQEKRPEQGVAAFTLQMIYGLVILPEYTPFSHPAVVDAVLQDVVPPSVTGNCDQDNFYITLNYGDLEPFFVVVVGKRLLTKELAQQYLTEGDANFTITVPFSSPDAVFESVHSSFVRSRLDVAVLNAYNITIKDFTLACSFFKTLTECFSNGTMTALAVKVESAPSLNPSQLSLSDLACGPTYSDDRFAYFHFTVNSCGTTRKFINNVMLYENEITLPDQHQGKTNTETTSDSEEEYQLTVSCYYVVNVTHTLAFLTRPHNEPFEVTGTSQLMVRMRLAHDASYNSFHQEEDYPVVTHLRQPLYFEVEFTRSTDSKVALVLDHCWATLNKDGDSQPRWNLLVNGCERAEAPYRVVFHPVVADSRVHFPSHIKRFEVQMFSFAKDVDYLSGQLFVHCVVLICDANSPSGLCRGQCVNQDNNEQGPRPHKDICDTPQRDVSSGQILRV